MRLAEPGGRGLPLGQQRGQRQAGGGEEPFGPGGVVVAVDVQVPAGLPAVRGQPRRMSVARDRAVVNTTLRVLRTSRAVPSSASNRRIRGAECGLCDTDPCERAGKVQLLRQHQEVPQAHRIRRHVPSLPIDNDPF
jgi:hypothetical protein